jgi:hypothetical protein
MLVGGKTPTPPITAPFSRLMISLLGSNTGELHIGATNIWNLSHIYFAFSKSGAITFVRMFENSCLISSIFESIIDLNLKFKAV